MYAMTMQVRKALESDRQGIPQLLTAAFGIEEGSEIAELVDDLMGDASAQPSLSLVATDNDHVVGHILFTNARIEHSRQNVSSVILAPLSVHPRYQNHGIGGRLIEQGLKELKVGGFDLVFVLGHPTYYPKYGFTPARSLGFEATYPIPAENSDAWMVQELHPGVIGHVGGKVICADALNDPKYWRE